MIHQIYLCGGKADELLDKTNGLWVISTGTLLHSSTATEFHKFFLFLFPPPFFFFFFLFVYSVAHSFLPLSKQINQPQQAVLRR